MKEQIEIMVNGRENTDKKHAVQKRIVDKINWLSSSVFELQLEKKGIDFTPGDCVSIYDDSGTVSREYSIASGIHDRYLSFLIKSMGDGAITDYLSQRKPGDKVNMSLPYGGFHPGLQNGNHPFIFIATGTGISPFLSYIKSYPHHPPVCMLHGVSTKADALGYKLFRKKCPTYLAISQEKHNRHHHGRVTDLLGTLPLAPNTHFYLCGLDGMIQETSEWLEARDIRQENIHREVFFFSSYQ